LFNGQQWGWPVDAPKSWQKRVHSTRSTLHWLKRVLRGSLALPLLSFPSKHPQPKIPILSKRKEKKRTVKAAALFLIYCLSGPSRRSRRLCASLDFVFYLGAILIRLYAWVARHSFLCQFEYPHHLSQNVRQEARWAPGARPVRQDHSPCLEAMLRPRHGPC